MTVPGQMTPEEAALAAEYALGLLEGAERQRFEALLRGNPVLLGEVHDWQEYFVSLTEEVSKAPPRRVKRRLTQRLFGARLGALRFWQGLSAAGLASSAGLAAFIALQPIAAPPPAPAPQPITLIASEMTAPGEDLRLLALFDGQELHLNHTAGAPPEGRALELWLIAGDAAPVSLGVLNAAGDLPDARLPDPLPQDVDLILAVTDEPPTGAPGGTPTGQVRAAGALVPIWQVWR